MSNPYGIVDTFEREIAAWAGAKYGVAVESCTAAIFLCLKYYNNPGIEIDLPKYTYPGVAMSVINAGYKIKFLDWNWTSRYSLHPTHIIDSALHFSKYMYSHGKSFWCLSFHAKKHLPIGRGGMILTDDKEAVEWFKMARFDGRTEGVSLDKDNATICGWNFYMTPEQAARGLMLFDMIKDKDLPDLKVEEQNYPDLSLWRCFK